MEKCLCEIEQEPLRSRVSEREMKWVLFHEVELGQEYQQQKYSKQW